MGSGGRCANPNAEVDLARSSADLDPWFMQGAICEPEGGEERDFGLADRVRAHHSAGPEVDSRGSVVLVRGKDGIQSRLDPIVYPTRAPVHTEIQVHRRLDGTGR